MLNAYFWGDDVYFWGYKISSWGNNVDFWVFSKILGFLEFNFCWWGRFGTLWVGGASQGFFENI